MEKLKGVNTFASHVTVVVSSEEVSAVDTQPAGGIHTDTTLPSAAGASGLN